MPGEEKDLLPLLGFEIADTVYKLHTSKSLTFIFQEYEFKISQTYAVDNYILIWWLHLTISKWGILSLLHYRISSHTHILTAEHGINVGKMQHLAAQTSVIDARPIKC